MKNETENSNEGEIKVLDAETDQRVSGWGCRHTQCLILFFTLSIAYSVRACMGVALIGMLADDDDHENNTIFMNSNHTPSINASVENVTQGFFQILMIAPPFPKFSWSKKAQDTILASFFWGYMLGQVPAGQIAHRLGPRYLLVRAMMINCLMSLLLPLAANYGGWICVILSRFGQGLSQSCLFPCMHTLFGKWAPVNERGRMTAIAYGAQGLGPVLGLPMTGFIASSPMGWPGIFYTYGILSGIIAAVLWWKIADTPIKHPSISTRERRYIEESLDQKDARKLPVPWSKILRSGGMFAIVISHISYGFAHLMLYIEVPFYMNKVMGIDIKTNGLLTALPFLVMWLANFFFSWVTDIIIVKKYLSVTNCRKLANSIGSISSSLGFIALAFVPKNIYAVETILCLIGGLKVSTQFGFQVNHIDISPNFAGTMISISNFMTNLCASFTPIISGLILTDVTDEYLWRRVFFLLSAILFISNIVYVVFGTAEIAEWNEPIRRKETDDIEQTKSMIKNEIDQ